MEDEMQMTNFLKRVLLLDAASCLGMGAGLALGAAMLAGPLGLSERLIEGAGLVLIPIGLFIGWLGTRSAAPAALVWVVIVGNVGWTAESLFVAFRQAGITALGTAFVAVQAAAVLGLALLEYVGVRKAPVVAV
jgi:hypothetical protein